MDQNFVGSNEAKQDKKKAAEKFPSHAKNYRHYGKGFFAVKE
jgi:hypothetical protein